MSAKVLQSIARQEQRFLLFLSPQFQRLPAHQIKSEVVFTSLSGLVSLFPDQCLDFEYFALDCISDTISDAVSPLYMYCILVLKTKSFYFCVFLRASRHMPIERIR